MKSILTLLLLTQIIAFSKEGWFKLDDQSATQKIIEDKLVITIPIKQVETPKLKNIQVEKSKSNLGLFGVTMTMESRFTDQFPLHYIHGEAVQSNISAVGNRVTLHVQSIAKARELATSIAKVHGFKLELIEETLKNE